MIESHIKVQLKALHRKVRRTVTDITLRPEPNYRLYLRYKYHADKPRGYPESTKWNAVLRTRQEWEEAARKVAMLGLGQHGDLPKNWDSIAAVDCILKRTTTDAHILDAGAELYSVILPWLYLYGYKHLTGINLAFDRPVKRGLIRYEYGDITQTRFAEKTFDAITCMSVIEHGVDLRSYFREVSRILKPNGIVITSTDYYTEPSDTGDKKAFGVPVHVFSKDEIISALNIAREYDLELTDDINLDCQEKPVHWEQFGLDYTFLVFTLQKVGPMMAGRDRNAPQSGQ